jgi:formyltetrahydrofolate deformylase
MLRDGNKTSVELTVVGDDRKGVVAAFTNFIFKHRGNIEATNQSVNGGFFGMHLEASFDRKPDKAEFTKGLAILAKKLGMEVGVHYHEHDREQNLAILVTKESHCLTGILSAVKSGRLKVKVPVIIGSEGTLASVAGSYGIPFRVANQRDQDKRERRIFQILQRYNIDIIALARYMRILTPGFVWRYPNKIINIHPSLLPAFPGAMAYQQAFENGARVVGCTAHFVMMGLDVGPIIWQEALRVRPAESLQSIRLRGQQLEVKTLVKALQLFTLGKVEVRWGKTYFNS